MLKIANIFYKQNPPQEQCRVQILLLFSILQQMPQFWYTFKSTRHGKLNIKHLITHMYVNIVTLLKKRKNIMKNDAHQHFSFNHCCTTQLLLKRWCFLPPQHHPLCDASLTCFVMCVFLFSYMLHASDVQIVKCCTSLCCMCAIIIKTNENSAWKLMIIECK